MSRCLGLDDGVKTAIASAISTSSPPPSDEDSVTEANCALLTGMTRVAGVVEEAEEEAEEEEEAQARRGRFFDGVSGAKMPSSSSEAETVSESEKATLRFAPPLMKEEEVQFALASRIADLVGEADRECDGVLVGVFIFNVDADAAAEASAEAFFLRISLVVAHIDSFNSMHSSSIILKRRSKSLSEMPYLSINGKYGTLEVESWAKKKTL
jgi:hypothetical protein